ncbi:MAG: hypothetical protein HFJ86_06350 [Oscillospiraceae bacterium]|nr:hypothetical protein [Oscillospiraceae bacterium]
MRPERDDLHEQPHFYDGWDSVIQDEPYEPTGEMAYREKTKRVKKAGKESKRKEY